MARIELRLPMPIPSMAIMKIDNCTPENPAINIVPKSCTKHF
jgi:hypothetical protein